MGSWEHPKDGNFAVDMVTPFGQKYFATFLISYVKSLVQTFL